MALTRRDRRAWARELERPREGRLLAGVCAGIAHGLTIDVTLLRLAMVLLALASGIGLLLYAAAWLLLPQEDSDLPSRFRRRDVVRNNLQAFSDEIRLSARNVGLIWARTGQATRWPRPLTRRWIAIGMIGVGLLIFLYSLGVFRWLGTGRTLGLAVIAVGAAVLVAGTSGWRR